MNSKEALKRVKQAHYTAMACLGIEKPDIETEKAIDIIEKDLELLEILKKLVLGVGTEEDIAAARKHFEMEIKQAFKKSREGCTIIKLDLEK